MFRGGGGVRGERKRERFGMVVNGMGLCYLVTGRTGLGYCILVKMFMREWRL